MHSPPFQDPSLTVGVAFAAGVLCQIFARALQIPGIVLLLATGVLLGPEGLGLVRPALLGGGLKSLVGFAVAVILFEGGMNLDVRHLQKEAPVIRRLVTWGALITAAGGALAARWVMGWDWGVAVLFGSLVVVTGPTVVTPLLRRIKVRRSVHRVLEAEGVLIDAVGALGAVVALEVLLGPGDAWLSTGILGLGRRWGAGLICGAAGGLLVGLPLKLNKLPNGLENIFALGAAIGTFAVSNALAAESGVLAAIVAGMVVANLRTSAQRELLEFKEQLTVLMVSVLFILLSADVRLADVTALGWRGLATVALLVLAVRPLDVATSTWRSELSGRERLFIAWLAPRGIVAAAVAALFAQSLEAAQIPGARPLQALVFLVIAVTVVVQGLSGSLVARLLGLRQEPKGVLILGADALGRSVGELLKTAGQEVALIDANPDNCRLAEELGLKVIYGSALDERTLARGEPGSRRACLALTRNEGVNLLFARHVREWLLAPRILVAIHRGRVGVNPRDVARAKSEVLFAAPVDLDQWSAKAGRNALEVWSGTLGKDAAPVTFEKLPDASGLPLLLQRGKDVDVVGSLTTARPGDRLTALLDAQHLEPALKWLAEGGWQADRAEPGAEKSGAAHGREQAQ